MKKARSARLALVVIASLFILPLALAWLMYSGAIDYNPVKTRNLGTLVEPPVPVSFDELQWLTPEGQAPGIEGHWVILFALPEDCADDCLQTAADLRQVHRAAGRNQSRIRLLLLGQVSTGTARELARISPDFKVASAFGKSLDTALRQIAADRSALMDKSVYLIDPLGNIMLFYAAGFDPNDLKKDLKRLLTWSKLDEQ